MPRQRVICERKRALRELSKINTKLDQLHWRVNDVDSLATSVLDTMQEMGIVATLILEREIELRAEAEREI